MGFVTLSPVNTGYFSRALHFQEPGALLSAAQQKGEAWLDFRLLVLGAELLLRVQAVKWKLKPALIALYLRSLRWAGVSLPSLDIFHKDPITSESSLWEHSALGRERGAPGVAASLCQCSLVQCLALQDSAPLLRRGEWDAVRAAAFRWGYSKKLQAHI